MRNSPLLSRCATSADTLSDSSVPTPAASASLFRLLTCTGFMLLTLVACGGGGGGSGPSFDGGGIPSGTGVAAAVAGLKVGTGSGAAYQDGVISSSLTRVEAGDTATLRVNVVTAANEPPTTPVTVRFSSICASNGLATIGEPVQVTQGLFSASYINSGCNGEDTITATLIENNDTATVKLTVVGPDVLAVSFVSSSFAQLSLAGIGGNESAELTFKVAGPQGVPVVGKQVTFSINTSVGGASILPSRATGITDQQGLVRTILNSGTVAGPVNVLATHQESGRQGLSGDITISTGVPVASRFSLSYTPFNPPHAFDTDGVQVTLSIIASDVFGNNPTDGTRVSFVAAESGNIENSCALVNGICSVVWRSSAPRPADMRVEVIAYTDGAENFIDNNGNSLFDGGDGAISEPGEPYADENEDARYNLGEFFFDTNRNGIRDAGNGLWDGPCLDKVNAAAICTGNKTATIFATATIVMSTDTVRFRALGTFPAPGTAITLRQGTSITLGDIILGDNNRNADSLGGNPLPLGTTVTFVVEGTGATLQGLTTDTIVNTLEPTGPYGVTVVATAVEPDATLPTNVRLLMNVAVPGESTQQFAWPLNITL